MSNNGRGRRPYIPPVRRIEMPEINEKARWIAIVVLLAIGVVAIGKGLYALVSVQPGWQTVEVASKQPSCSREFALQYDFSDGNASARMRQLSEVYRQATEDAYRIFSAQEEGSENVYDVNAHPNEPVTVDPALYEALSLVDEKTALYFFLAPAMEEYNRMFLCQDDGEAARYDPTRNPETAAWLKQLAGIISDPAQISLEVLGENQVQLHVSPEYLDFAAENGIEAFFDFGWMKNAFIADFLAEVLTENGFTNGYLVSFDGFTRNLDTRGNDYTVNLFDHRNGQLYLPGKFQYAAPMSLVSLRDYPMSDQDQWHYYTYETGETVTAFLDPRDAMSKTSIGNLLGYSENEGCARILLELLPVFVADEFNHSQLETAAGEKIYSIWCTENTIRHTEEQAELEVAPDSGYRVK